MDYKFLNSVRVHNIKETAKHFMIKAMCLKVLFNAGYYVYSERNIFNHETRVADICAHDKNNICERSKMIIVEVETRPTKKHNEELLKFYEEYNLYIIDVKKISDDLKKMEKQIKHILGA